MHVGEEGGAAHGVHHERHACPGVCGPSAPSHSSTDSWTYMPFLMDAVGRSDLFPDVHRGAEGYWTCGGLLGVCASGATTRLVEPTLELREMLFSPPLTPSRPPLDPVKTTAP
eukprot:6280745-Pyramimonas_sp.AAC.1